MIILGIDQSTKASGWCIVDGKKIIKSGKFTAGNLDRLSRTVQTIDFIEELIDEYKVELVAIEDVFLQTFKGRATQIDTFATLNKNIGSIEYMLFKKGVPYEVIKPSQWRSTLKIKGRARQEQKVNTRLKVYELFGIQADEDVADAICIAVHSAVKHAHEDK